MKSLFAGALAGLIATVPMTAVMALGHRFLLPPRERYDLPPRQITLRTVEKTGVDVSRDLNENERRAATLIAHYGFGAAAGALYAAAPRILGRERHPDAAGVGWGLAVWAGSYQGWLPAAKILRPATEQPARRTLLMIGAHVVWGAVLGIAADWLTRPGDGASGGPTDL